MKKLPYCYRQQNRHGTWVVYVQRGGGKKIRIREPYGSKAFMEAYRAALAGTTPLAPKEKAGTMAHLIRSFMASPAWAATAAETRKQFGYQYRKVELAQGDRAITAVTKRHIAEGRDRRAGTPSDANKFVKSMRRLFDFAEERGLVEANPAKGVTLVPLPNEDGFHTWTEDEIRQFEGRWPTGTRQRLALDILLYTGMRRSDVVRLGRQHLKDGVLSIRTQKTGEIVVLPLLEPLAQSIDATPTGEITFLCTERGKSFDAASFGNWFRKACRAAGVPGAAHGIRKAAAVRAAERGATEAQLNAIFGWAAGSRESATYVQKANRAKMARDAVPQLFFPTSDKGGKVSSPNVLKKKGN